MNLCMTTLYNLINTNVPKLQRMSTDTFLHNKHRLKHIPKGPETFEGRYNCGASCAVIKNNSDVESDNTLAGFRNVTTVKYDSVDHVILRYKDIIIDPTYRQFLTPDYDSLREDVLYDVNLGIDPYHNWLFTQPPVLCNTRVNIHKFITEAQDRHNEQYEQKKSFDYVKDLIMGNGTPINLNINS